MRVECANESRCVSTSDAAPYGYWLGESSPATRDRLSVRSGLNVGLRRVEGQARVTLANADSRIDVKDILEVGQDLAPEVTWPAIVGTELILQTPPWNQGGLLEIAHPVGEPDVEVDGQGRSLELTDGSEIHGDGRTSDVLEEVPTQDGMRSPG